MSDWKICDLFNELKLPDGTTYKPQKSKGKINISASGSMPKLSSKKTKRKSKLAFKIERNTKKHELTPKQIEDKRRLDAYIEARKNGTPGLFFREPASFKQLVLEINCNFCEHKHVFFNTNLQSYSFEKIIEKLKYIDHHFKLSPENLENFHNKFICSKCKRRETTLTLIEKEIFRCPTCNIDHPRYPLCIIHKPKIPKLNHDWEGDFVSSRWENEITDF